MTDFHMHVLPGMDDGSRDIDTSTAMLERSAAHGVNTVAATSHFYAEDNDIARFLARRQSSYERLMEAVGGRNDLPQLLLGAEVLYFSGMSTVDTLDALCLEGTNLLLLEMPFVQWTDRVLREVEAIQRSGLQVVAAHIERYMSIQPRRIMDAFFALGTYIQCNGSFFLSRWTTMQAMRMFRQGQIQFLGSDAHNMTSRPPDLGEAVKIIGRKLGQRALVRFFAEADFLVNGGHAG